MPVSILFVGGPADGEYRVVEDLRPIVYPVRIGRVSLVEEHIDVDYEQVIYMPFKFGVGEYPTVVIYAQQSWNHFLILIALVRRYGETNDKAKV